VPFAPVFLRQKLQRQNITCVMLRKALLYKKYARKMLMKSTLALFYGNQICVTIFAVLTSSF